MATMFGGSRLANLREKRASGDEITLKKEDLQKLSLPSDETDKIGYEPSSIHSNGRMQTRLLKGRIERPAMEIEDQINRNQNFCEPKSVINPQPKLTMSPQTEQLRLVLNDAPVQREERKNSVEPMRTTQKRILIAKQPEKEQVQSKHVEQIKQKHLVQVPEPEPEKAAIVSQEKPIREEEVEQSMQGESDLVECPEGCGRKFNRKALEKHAKACKIVFMSKRKEFNSEAKRMVNKEQVAIAKQKEKQKKEGKAKGKGFEKTSDNWKTASQDFRAAVKAIKKEVVQSDQGNGAQMQKEEEQEEMKIIPCRFCEKPFAEVFLQMHMKTCGKRKETEKKKTLKK